MRGLHQASRSLHQYLPRIGKMRAARNWPIPYMRWYLHIQGSKQPSDIAPIRTSRQTLESVNPRPLNTICKMRVGPLLLAAVSKECSESHGDIVHSDTTPAACATASQVRVHIGGPHIREVSSKSAVPS